MAPSVAFLSLLAISAAFCLMAEAGEPDLLVSASKRLPASKDAKPVRSTTVDTKVPLFNASASSTSSKTTISAACTWSTVYRSNFNSGEYFRQSLFYGIFSNGWVSEYIVSTKDYYGYLAGYYQIYQTIPRSNANCYISNSKYIAYTSYFTIQSYVCC